MQYVTNFNEFMNEAESKKEKLSPEFMSELIKLSKSKVNSDVIKSINDLDVLKNKKKTIVGLIADPERLVDIRKNRLNTLSEEKHTSYVDLDKIREELEESKKIFK